MSFELIAYVSIGLGWLLATGCIFSKYDKDKKICFISDLVKITFTTLTLVVAFNIAIRFEAYLVVSGFADRIDKTATVKSGPEFKTLGEHLRPIFTGPDGEKYSIVDERVDITELNEAIEQYFNERYGNILLGGGSRPIFIVGPEDHPFDFHCTLAHQGIPDTNYQNNEARPYTYRVICDREWG